MTPPKISGHAAIPSSLSIDPSKIQSHTKKFFKLKSRTRAILVLLGSIAMITSWFLPWYDVLYWLSPSAFQAAMQSGHYEAVAQVTGFAAEMHLYGSNVVQVGYSGASLAQTGFIGLSQNVFYWWLALGGLALLTVWTDEWSRNRGITRHLKTILDCGKVSGLIFQVGTFVWIASSVTSRAVVNKAATDLIVKDIGHTSGMLYVSTGLSVGLISLFLGLILALLGIMTGNASEQVNPSGLTTSKAWGIARLTANACLTIAIFYLLICLALFV